MIPSRHTDALTRAIRAYRWTLPLVIFLVLCAYAPAIGGDFLLDDIPLIRDAHLRHMSPWVLVRMHPTRWLVFLSFQAHVFLTGNATWSFHLVNLLLHALTAWGTGLLLLTIWPFIHKRCPTACCTLSPFWTAFGAALIFALHPFAIQGALYISQRSTTAFSLCAVFALVLLLRALKPSAHNRTLLLGGVLLLFIIGLACKEIAVVIPFLLIACMWVIYGTPPRRVIRPIHWCIGGTVILILLLLPALIFAHLSQWNLTLIRQNIQGVGGQLTVHSPDLTHFTYMLTQPRVIMTYARLMILPIGLSIDHHMPVCTSPLSICFLIPAFCLLIWVIGAFLLRKKSPLILWGTLLFFLPLLPQSSVIPSPDLMFEHRAYLSLAGLITCGIGLCDLLFRALRSEISIRIIAILLLLLPLPLAATTFMRARIWRTELTVWESAYALAPYKQRVAINYANALRKDGYIEDAEFVLERLLASEQEDFFPEALMERGNLYFTRGYMHGALTNYLTVVRHYPAHLDARYNLAMIYFLLQNDERAIHHLNMILRMNPYYADAHFFLGRLYERSPNTHARAREHLNVYLQLAPQGENARVARAILRDLAEDPAHAD